ncbi:MAG TPA: hypothetical protein VHX60_01675 [Acidobacteriaceae bacterium]|jgi:hypothetical protein|nr:hypothetical protein [Acidobacteriaceae bacterium]
MRAFLRALAILCLFLSFTCVGLQAQAAPPPANQNFRVAVYIPVSVVEHMRDPAWLASSWQQISAGVHVDKVYIETYRSRTIADDDLIESVKKFFVDHGVQVAGGIAFSDRDAAQFRSFSYTDPAQRAYVKHVAEVTARHFDEIILDDFFFNNTKDPSDIAAKGTQTWSAFRLKLMDEVSRDLVLDPARAVNPKVKIIIKFPNWYPHFQGDGYDLAVEPKLFSGLYTGTETRDGEITDQHLQAYESYAIMRYFDNVAPAHNGGGWVDTYDIRYIDRYAEQLWDTLLAKSPQIMLFEWNGLLRPAPAGHREAWAAMHPSFDYAKRFGDHTPDYAAVAGHALNEIDPLIGKLGAPLGVAVYRPLNSTGEDFLEDYLGEIGIPIELYPDFPRNAKTILLTEAAAHDPALLAKIKAHLEGGGNIVITSGLQRALGQKLDDLVELRNTGRKITPTEYWGAYGAGGGANMGTSPPILVPKIDFMTNDAWPLIRGTANGGGAPILLMDRYGKGVLYVLTIPDNFNDLYALPAAVLTSIRGYVSDALPVQLDGSSQVSLFPYDNHTFVLESFRGEPVSLSVSIAGTGGHLRNLATGAVIDGKTMSPANRGASGTAPTTAFSLTLPPHSYAGFAIESADTTGK